MRTLLPRYSGLALAGLVLSTMTLRAEEKPTPQGGSVITAIFQGLLGGSTPAATAPGSPQQEAAAKGSHKVDAPIVVLGSDGRTRLQTLCVDPEGRVLALVAPPRGYGAPAKNASGEVQVFGKDGKQVKHWKVDFHTHSINTGPDGIIYVAGDGKIARFDSQGKLLSTTELPFIAEALKDKDALRKEAEEQLKQQRESMKRVVEVYRKRVDDLEKIAEDKRTTLQKRQLQQYKQLLKSYEGPIGEENLDSIIQSKIGRLRIINGVAVSSKDVFVACGEGKGYGYAVWRLDHDLKNPKRVLTGLGGCCGQMDIQCCEEDLLVAENTRHQFARYDRDGKARGSWGKRTTGNDLSCFGGCCNPMNLRVLKGKEIYTAESEGLIKRFSDKGEFLGVVGHAPLTGGCKNVAVGVSPDGSKVYFADQPGSRIIVLTRKPSESTKE
ncbi:MAG: hypothetical protein U0840_10805 [Gemmataceae bacterium]